jgi:hypothetical protein
LAVVFAQVAPRGVLSPGVGVFAYLGQKVVTCANLSESKYFRKRARRVCLPSYDYFKNQSLWGFPPATWANIWITIGRRVRFVPHDDWSLPPVTTNGTRRLADGLLKLLQTAIERHRKSPFQVGDVPRPLKIKSTAGKSHGAGYPRLDAGMRSWCQRPPQELTGV